jgi:hypothetical protein
VITSCEKKQDHLTIRYKNSPPNRQEIFDIVLNKFGNEFDDFRYIVTEELGNSGTGLVLVDIDFGNLKF